MKIIKALIALSVLMLSFNVASAAVPYARVNYGGYYYSHGIGNFEGSITSNVTRHINVDFNMNRTSEDSYRGKYSQKIDYRSAYLPGGSATLFELDIPKIRDYMKDDYLYCEYFIKGTGGIVSGKAYPYLMINKTGIGHVDSVKAKFYAEEVERGWFKVYALMPLSQDKDYDSVRFGVGINRASADDNTFDIIYLDDMSVRYVPASISVKNGTYNKKELSLDKIKVLGNNIYGEAKSIDAVDLVNYSVISGNGFIQDGKLIYSGEDNGVVTLKAEFFTLTDIFNVRFYIEDDFDVSTIQSDDGVYFVNVKNNTRSSADIVLMVTISDEQGRLSVVKTETANVASGAAKTLTTQKVEVPFYINSPQFKTYVFHKVNGKLKPLQ